MREITPCLWFDTEGDEAANFYTSLFPNSRILEVARYGSAGPRPEGTVMTVSFELDGQKFLALNGGPDFTFSEAISFQVFCTNQEEVDAYWSKLSEGGEEGPCGWLKDKFGLSWQIIPTALPELLGDPDEEKAQRVMAAMLNMKKIEVAVLEEFGAPLEVQEVDLAEPQVGEVLVRLVACGVCHTDLYTASGADPSGYAPAVLGHEGAGVVEQLGEGVGDHVVTLFSPQCRECIHCADPRTNLCLAIRGEQNLGHLPDGTTRLRAGG